MEAYDTLDDFLEDIEGFAKDTLKVVEGFDCIVQHHGPVVA